MRWNYNPLKNLENSAKRAKTSSHVLASTADTSLAKISRLLVIVVVSLIAIGVLFYTVSTIKENLRESPQKVFTSMFETKLANIGDLEGFGGWVAGYDYWMHFKSKSGQRAVLKHESDFEKEHPEIARNWFLGRFPSNKALMDNQHLTLIFRQKATQTYVINEWLLYNTKTHEHFYRVWGLK